MELAHTHTRARQGFMYMPYLSTILEIPFGYLEEYRITLNLKNHDLLKSNPIQ